MTDTLPPEGRPHLRLQPLATELTTEMTRLGVISSIKKLRCIYGELGLFGARVPLKTAFLFLFPRLALPLSSAEKVDKQ